MLLEQFTEAAATARTMAALDNVAQMTWKALAEGLLSDADAEAISAAVEARRGRMRGFQTPSAKRPPVTRYKPPTSPDRRASIERRRRQAMSGALPPALACQFTQGEVAVLSVVARIVKQQGSCDAHIDKLAALAGVCRSTVKNALRHAKRLDILTVDERRRRGQRSDTNIVRITSREWSTWLKLKGDRGQKSNHHDYSLSFSTEKAGDKRPTSTNSLISGEHGPYIRLHGTDNFAPSLSGKRNR